MRPLILLASEGFSPAPNLFRDIFRRREHPIARRCESERQTSETAATSTSNSGVSVALDGPKIIRAIQPPRLKSRIRLYR